MDKKIYLDNGATTKVDDQVVKDMLPYFTRNYGNPSSLHAFGIEADEALNKARKKIADAINANSFKEIIFTGSATEADSIALMGVAFANKGKKDHIITTKIEHKAILETCKQLENHKFKITYLDVDSQGFVDLKQLEKSITKKTILVSVMHSNHEVGTIQDLEKIGRICKQKGVLFHTDAAQSFTKTSLDVQKYKLELVSLNAHKMHGPKGIGVLYVKEGTKINPITAGGGQEFGIRAGTQNLPYIVGFAKAAEIGMGGMAKNVKKMIILRDYIIQKLLKIPNTKLNGPTGNKRLCNNVNISFDFVEGEAMLMHLNLIGIFVSTGSACSSKSLKPSHILTAMGMSAEKAHGSLRITLSKYTTKNEVDFAVKKVRRVVQNLRKLSPLSINE
ncbi:cysteine desulfurase [Candidatus Woesearchaeota archaeon]|nr:cysteine desulfurase [Candidatus Woesearchaeota archaeon]